MVAVDQREALRGMLHKDRVKVRIVRQDRKGRPEGRVVEIMERPAHPIIGRLLNEGGIWIVAPEDKRYGQDILIPKVGIGTGKPGQVVVVELTEPPALFGQPVGRVKKYWAKLTTPVWRLTLRFANTVCRTNSLQRVWSWRASYPTKFDRKIRKTALI